MHRFILMVIFGLLQAFTLIGLAAGDVPREIQQRCQKPLASEPFVYADDFKWGMGLHEVGSYFKETYSSGKRLKHRAYYSSELDKIVLPLHGWGETVQEVALPFQFIKNLRHQFERALTLNYAQYIFFPDMGHTHLFFPEKAWQDHYDALTSDRKAFFESAFQDHELKILYHTAEMILLKDKSGLTTDDFGRWRYYSRNLVAANSPQGAVEVAFAAGERFNSVHDYPGHKYWGAGFSVSSSKDGCFAYRAGNETLYFDISFEDLPYRDLGFEVN